MVLALENQPAVNLIREHEDVAVADRLGNLLDATLAQHATRGIVRRVQNNKPCAVVNEAREFVHVKGEILLLAQTNWHSASAHVANHRLVNRKPRVRIDDFVAVVDESQNRKKDDRLATRHNDHFVRRDLNFARATHFAGNGLAKFGISS